MRRSLLALAAMLALAGCRGGTQDAPPIMVPSKVIDVLMGVTNMDDQPKYKSQEDSSFFPDGRTSRMPPEHTVARGALRADPAFYRGVGADGAPLAGFPVEVNANLVERGRERYDIYCAPCHDQVGAGQGIVPKRGWIPPPSFHQDYLRAYTPGQFFQVITNGIRSMPSYAKQIPEQDRWAIVAYVQALQRSHYAKAAEVPAAQRGNLQ